MPNGLIVAEGPDYAISIMSQPDLNATSDYSVGRMNAIVWDAICRVGGTLPRFVRLTDRAYFLEKHL